MTKIPLFSIAPRSKIGIAKTRKQNQHTISATSIIWTIQFQPNQFLQFKLLHKNISGLLIYNSTI